jgi:hypothetical protein
MPFAFSCSTMLSRSGVERASRSGDLTRTVSPFETSSGIRIAFSCPEHGVHSIVDPFKGSR